ncbi:MAG: RidA family protein [Acidiferrobacterales bacterium]|nr:RidA family protein [Acidiferrobacterales bacterium]
MKEDPKVIYPEQAPDYYRDWGFSPAIVSNGLIFVSGCTGTRDDGSVPEGVGEQTRIAFKRINLSLKEAGVDFSDVIEMTTYHIGLNHHLKEFRKVKSEFIGEPYPAWTAVGVSELASKGALIEIKVVARARG